MSDIPPPPGAKPTKPKLLWLWVALGAVVVLVAGIAALTAGDDDTEVTVGTVTTEAPGASDGGTTATAAPGQLAQTWPVTVEGTPLAPLQPGTDDPAVGTAAPKISGYFFDGTPVVVDPSKGPVMLVFLAHWCPHCNREVPELNAWRDSGDVPADLQVIAVTTAVDPSRPNYPPSDWVKTMDWTWPVLADSEDYDAAQAFGVSGFPFGVIIGTDGKVIVRWSGELGQDGIASLVASALA
ncbi:MAG: TlpA disulfide reductase family protein [Acidimicrobiales bacterium]